MQNLPNRNAQVSKELAGDESPGLLESEALPEGDLLILLLLGPVDGLLALGAVILVDVLKLGLVDMLALLRLFVHEHPESHPDITDGAYDDEGHLPAAADALVLEELGEERNGRGSDEGAY